MVMITGACPLAHLDRCSCVAEHALHRPGWGGVAASREAHRQVMLQDPEIRPVSLPALSTPEACVESRDTERR